MIITKRPLKQKLIRLGYDHSDHRSRSFGLYRCECGNEVVRTDYSVRSGNTKTCGCIGRIGNQSHGLSYDPLYKVWTTIKQRCLNPKATAYKYYGERGISMFLDWQLSPENFIEYVLGLPNARKQGYSIDRIENDGNYEPGNIRWADRLTQRLNQRS